MAIPTIQTVVIAWLVASGAKHVKSARKYEVYTTGDGGNWYIGTGGSVRYGRTHAESYVVAKRFRDLTGQLLAEVTLMRRMPPRVDPVGLL